jgi:magnesium-transporting ATPase (P-type)
LRKNSNARSDVALPSGQNPTEVENQRKFSEFPPQAPADSTRRLSNDTHKKTVNFKFDRTARRISRIDPYEFPWGVSDSGDYVIAISGRAFKQFISDRLEIATRATGVSPTMAKLIETDKVLKLFLTKCLVYARMKPDQKSEAVSYIQDLYSKERILVGFCGYGANDCGALKTAHIGVSLSLSEASVAAPFTSNITNISSVIIVCAEGRSALTTSFQSFKYLCYYSILQCFGLILLYFVGIDYSFIMYIVNDLMIVFPLSLFMCYHGPYKKLSSFLPGDSLMAFPVLLSVFGQIVIGCIFVYFGQFIIKYGPNYQNTATISALNAGSWEPDNTTFWDGAASYYTTSVLNIFVALAFADGRPFRQSMFNNWIFIGWALQWTLYIGFTLVAPYTDHILWMSDFNEWVFGYSRLQELSESFTPMFCCF